MTNWRAVLLVFILGLTCSACGQKGPLYLPDAPEHPDAQPVPEKQTPADDQNELNNE